MGNIRNATYNRPISTDSISIGPGHPNGIQGAGEPDEVEVIFTPDVPESETRDQD